MPLQIQLMEVDHLDASKNEDRGNTRIRPGFCRRAGAATDVRAQDGQTPLGVALASGRRDLADWLDWRGWALPRRALQPADLPAAATAGDADAVRRLLDLGFAVDAVDAQGCSALLRACGGGHRAVVDLLLERGADPQLAARTGRAGRARWRASAPSPRPAGAARASRRRRAGGRRSRPGAC